MSSTPATQPTPDESRITIEGIADGERAGIDVVEAWRLSGAGFETIEIEDEEEVASEVARRARESGARLTLVTTDHHADVANIDDLCDALTADIVDAIPSIEDEDARDDDFDNHSLSAIRDALVEVSEAFGGNTPSP